MPSNAKKVYKAGDRVVLYLPNDVNPLLLKYINSQRQVSPAILEIVEQKAKIIYDGFDNILDKQEKKECGVNE